jgi:hypothetical protein
MSNTKHRTGSKLVKLFDPMSAKVIDGDKMVILEWFDPKDEYKVRQRYEAMGKWADVSVDSDGDIILFEDL